ncbi:hypothetical protein CUMW_190680 [Citrus unshiu]|nr:hypothetical protein CUMW_190680 [Citrus unshiu]
MKQPTKTIRQFEHVKPLFPFTNDDKHYCFPNIIKSKLRAPDDNSQTRIKRHSGRRNPRVSGQKVSNRKLPGLHGAPYNMIPGPFHPPTSACTGSDVHILTIIKSAQSKTPTPRQPTSWINHSIDITLHKHSP